MQMFTRIRALLGISLLTFSMALLFSAMPAAGHGGESGTAENGLFFVDYRNLEGGADGVLLMDLDPESPEFGSILQNFELGEGVVPHHLYYNQDQSRLYNTTLGGEFLYELKVERDENGIPTITAAEAIDVGDSMVGEDLYFSEDGSRFWMTFLGGRGGLQDGTVGVFDAQTNELIQTIDAPVPSDLTSGEPFILYPHGISANEDLGILMVTSTTHPDGASGVGNTTSVIDMETGEVLQTLLAADTPDQLSAPVEVLLLRDDFPAYALTTAMLTGDIWIAPYEEADSAFGAFSKAFSGAENNVGFALEFYIGPGDDVYSDEDKFLYVSFGVPGLVNVYSLDNLPELELVRTLPAEAGAHHMGFFRTESGREVTVIQNNLLNLNDPLPPLNAGSLMVVDIHTAEILGTVNLPETHGLLPESIESAMGNAHFVHH
jgi:DNA-binding beta-propeller fold protein YncE